MGVEVRVAGQVAHLCSWQPSPGSREMLRGVATASLQVRNAHRCWACQVACRLELVTSGNLEHEEINAFLKFHQPCAAELEGLLTCPAVCTDVEEVT